MNYELLTMNSKLKTNTMLWKIQPDLAALNASSKNTLNESMGVEYTEVGDDYLKARMPVDRRTVQPMGILHGGANVALAETLGSVASLLCLDDPVKKAPVGVEINANHLRPVTKGYVTGTVKPIKVGRQFHVWNIDIHDEEGRLTCVSRITVAVVDRR
jgi:1,4-dihydroxy-2-naphthoyl-CoA hydrolase